jgi:hypothetical protein
MARARSRVTVARMTTSSRDRGPSASGRPVNNIYDDLRKRNERRSDLARTREMRLRIERALQAARDRRFRSRG